MSSTMSLESVVSRLEAQIAFDREREAFHAEQEAHHRERRSVYAAEIEKLAAVLEGVKTAATVVGKLAERSAAYSPPGPNLDIGRKPSLTRMIRRIIEIRPAGDVFGANLVTAEINRHFEARLRRPVRVKLVSITLRRMLKQGELRGVREGKPHHEALYALA
jgi:hypothetical protein